MSNQIQAILANLAANNNKCIDDHNHRNEEMIVDAIAMHGKHVVFLIASRKTYFCINPLYIHEDGRVHLSTNSCGGTMDVRDQTLEQAVEEYNLPSEFNPGRAKLTEVTMVPEIEVPVTLKALTVTDEIYAASCEVHEEMKCTQFTNDLATVFLEACSRAQYLVPAKILTMVIGDGNGYYGPLRHVVLVDEDDNPIPANSSVAVKDPVMNRMVYVIVLAPGDNLVIHRHHVDTNNRFRLIATGHGRMKTILGMDMGWNNNIHGLINAARIFNMEFDQEGGNVVIVPGRTDNFFKAIKYVHVK